MERSAWQDARRRAEALVSNMTTSEMCGQLLHDAPSIPRLGLPAFNWWGEGLHGAARSGTATVFPQAIALAAMFDEPMMRRIGGIVSTEQRAKHIAFAKQGDRGIYKGLSVWSPNVNIFRDPRWGRGQETYGEDPVLTSILAVAFIEGLQGDDKRTLRCAACVKHFVAHSGPEAVRHHFNAEPSQKDLEETYLPAFEAAVKEAGVSAVMGAYNEVDGVPCCASSLIRSLIRDAWNFQGMFISDCWALRDFHEGHHVTKTPVQSAALALKSGCDLNCGCTYAYLPQALQEGLVGKECVKEACIRVMTIRCLLGFGDEHAAYQDIPFSVVDCQEHADIALKAAQESIVLLKNDGGFLPLVDVKVLGVIGPEADSRLVLMGNYHGTASRGVTILEGLRQAMPDTRILYSQGCDVMGMHVERLARDGDRLSEALAVCDASDVVILCLGLDERYEGEMHDDGNGGIAGDREDLRLPLCQRQLLDAVSQSGKPVVLLLSCGGALDPEIGGYSSVKALLQIWYPGQAGGSAVADILLGRVCPSGKLPVTFYKAETKLPPFTEYSMKGRTYRYLEEEPLYPFGFGLSFTRFRYHDVAFTWNADSVAVQVIVDNDGPMDGDEVTFVTLSQGHPHPFLASFARTMIPRGNHRVVSLCIPYTRFRRVGEDGSVHVAKGDWMLFVGPGVQEGEQTASVCHSFGERGSR